MKLANALTIALITLLGLSAWAQAEVRTIPMGAEKSELTLLQQDDTSLLYQVRVGTLTAMDVATPQGTFTRLMIPEFYASTRVGSPELPMMNRLIEVPYGASAHVEIVSESSRSITLSDYGITNMLFPAQPSMPKNADPATWPFIYDRQAYAAPRVAQQLSQVADVGQLRSVHVGRLEVSPVEYFPAENRILVHDQMTLRVRFEGGDRAAEENLKLSTASPFFDGLYDRIEGTRNIHDQYPDRVRDVVTMVIITPQQYATQMQTLADWKTTRGFRTIVGVLGTPEVGSTKEQVQAYLWNLYNNGNPQQPSPSFVLFVGDVDVMPTWTLSGDPTDRPYCAVDADLMPDMYYGRMSCANATQLQAILDKTLMYDQFTMPDPSYLGRVVMIGGMDPNFGQIWANGQINYGTTYYFNEAHGIYSYTHLYPQSGSQEAQICAELSSGVAYANYTAHGSETSWSDPTIGQAQVNALTNAGKYCLAVGNCCLTGKYSYPECLGETWLRAANKGGIGYIGAANYSYWDEDYWWGVGYRAQIVEHPTFDPNHMGAYDGIFHDHGEGMTKWYVTNDAYIFCGNLAVTEAGSSLIQYYWNVYNLSGDPSISTYQGVPTANTVTHPASLFATWTSIDVTAAPKSYFGLTKDGVVIGAGTTDANGNLTLPIWGGPLSPGTAHLVVMAQNKIPYQADLPVLAGNCSVSGTVTLEGQSDHSGVKVQAIPNGGVVYTDATGAYTLPGLCATEYTIRASKSGWSTESQQISLAEGEQLAGVNFLLQPAETIQNCRAPSLLIPDNNPTGISDAMSLRIGGTVSAVEVYVSITHPYIGDLIVTLRSPLGTQVTLQNRTGGGTDDINGWYPGQLTPAQSLDAFIGEPCDGEWVLTVSDNAATNVGALNQWCLRVAHLASTSGVEPLRAPSDLALYPCRPNPSTGAAAIRFDLPRAGAIDLGVFDVAGRRLATLASGTREAGSFEATWTGLDALGRTVAQGVYFYRLTAEGRTLSQRLMLVR